MKNIIFVWSNVYGFADNLKGLLTCLIISGKNNYNIKINCNLISTLQLEKYINLKYIDNFNVDCSNIKKFVGNNNKTSFFRYIKYQYPQEIINKDIYIMTNIDPFYLLVNNWDKHIKSFDDCIFNDQIKMLKNNIFLFDNINCNLLIDVDYDVVHFRFGDKYMDNLVDISDVLSNDNLNDICEFLNCHKNSDNLIILSDNHQINVQIIDLIKQLISYNIIEINNNKSIHFNKMNDHLEFFYVLEDFVILKNASKVFGYNWSGFSFYGAMFGNQKYQTIN